MNRGESIFDAVQGWDAERIRGAKVLVAGAGALGNEVLKNLALLGVSNIVVMDMDHVEPHNLSRAVLFREQDALQKLPKVDAAARSLLEINPELSVLTLQGDVLAALGIGLIREMDIVIGCFDNRLARLVLNRLCWMAGVPWVDGGILQLSGQVTAYVPGDSCYECQLSEGEWREISVRMGCADMTRRYAQQGRLPTTPLSAAVIGAVQVQEALRLLHTDRDSRKGGQMFSYEGAHLRSELYERRPLQEACLSHKVLNDAILEPAIGFESTLGEVLDLARDRHGLDSPKLMLRNGIVVELASSGGGPSKRVLIPNPYFSDALAQGFEEGRGHAIATRGGLREMVDLRHVDADVPLWRLGIPFADVLELRGSAGRLEIILGKDIAAMVFRKGVNRIPNPWMEMDLQTLRSVVSI